MAHSHGTEKDSIMTRFAISISQAKWELGAYLIYLEKGKKCNITHILCSEEKSYCYQLYDYVSKQGFLPLHIFYRGHSEVAF